VLPSSRLADTAQQVRASALYFQNWLLASNAVSYLKSTSAPSPVQHFWSLSVEEQFYLVWPLLFLAALLVTRTRRRQAGEPGASKKTLHRVAVTLTAILVAASLAYSVYDTKADPAAAYFVTTTRMWELGAGGLLALLPAAATSRVARHGWLGWAGLAMIAGSQVVLNGGTPFPGWIALLPVAGTVALIAGGSAQATRGPWRLTSARPMTFLGGISYSLYLWHWPVIVLWTTWRGHPVSAISGPLIIAASVVLAWLTKVTVEDRVRLAPVITKSQWRSLSTALAAAVPVTLVAVFLATQPGPWDGRLPQQGYPGAAALAANVSSVPALPVLPSPDDAATTLPGYWASGCLDGQHVVTPKPCYYGDTAHPTLKVVLVGDSVAGNWWAPLAEIASQEHWELITELHATCVWTAAQLYDVDVHGPYPACHQWGATMLTDLITTIRPDLVIATGNAGMTTVAHPTPGSAARAEVGAGEAAYWAALQAHGIPVIAIRETPDTGQDEPACVSQYGPTAKTCSVSRATATFPDPPTSYAARALHGTVPVIDMTSLICEPTVCPPVVGNVLIYFDSHHMTQAYSSTLAPYLKAKLLTALATVRPARK
jgi:peptidoglycan/LPS O-acetylase OafA/YrhL